MNKYTSPTTLLVTAKAAWIIPAKPIPATIVPITEVDFGKVKWDDDPVGQTVIAKHPQPGLQSIVIMGGDSKTPYNPEWSQADAEAAFLAHLNLVAGPEGTLSLATPPATPQRQLRWLPPLLHSPSSHLATHRQNPLNRPDSSLKIGTYIEFC